MSDSGLLRLRAHHVEPTTKMWCDDIGNFVVRSRSKQGRTTRVDAFVLRNPTLLLQTYDVEEWPCIPIRIHMHVCKDDADGYLSDVYGV